MKILVTGGRGVIGRAVVRRFESSGHEVHVVARPRGVEPFERHASTLIPLDISSAESSKELNRVIVDRGVERIVHLAAIVGGRAEADPESSVNTNVRGTVNLLEACKGTIVDRLVMTSTKAVYGDIPNPNVTGVMAAYAEGDLCPHPRSIYGSTKLAAEHIAGILADRYERQLVILRMSSTVGPGKKLRPGATQIVGRVIEDSVAGLPVVGKRGLDQIDDFVYIEDVARACVLAIEKIEPISGMFHISSGQGVALSQIVSYVSQLFPKARIEIGSGTNFFDLPYNLHCVLDYTLAKTEIGFEPEFKFPVWIKHYVEQIIKGQPA